MNVYRRLDDKWAVMGGVRWTNWSLFQELRLEYADGSQTLIQVCANPEAPETLAREVRALQTAAREVPSARTLILTAASHLTLPHPPAPIQIMPAWRWMLDSAG